MMEYMQKVDLSPAQWIWIPSKRTLPNTFALFRKSFILSELPFRAIAHIAADSRYKLFANGRRIQWGPAPCDPRYQEAEQADITRELRLGENALCFEVLYYGFGDGTWVAGKPGLICKLELFYSDGRTKEIVSGSDWLVCIDRAHRPGQYKRWFLRSLQETYDARLRDRDWNQPGYQADERWMAAMPIGCDSSRPTVTARYPDYLDDSSCVNPEMRFLSPRTIPQMREELIPVRSLEQQGTIDWKRETDDWFEFRVPDSFHSSEEVISLETGEECWEINSFSHANEGKTLIFKMEEEVVGFPGFTICAPSKTVVELITQEAHDKANGIWLDSHFYTWSRFICEEGENRFETFDFEAVMWLQLHIHNTTGPVLISDVAVRRRTYPWENTPHIRCSEPALERLFDAGVNTILNNAQETIVDGMGRERQQYAGDLTHELDIIQFTFGENKLIERYFRTFNAGLCLEGYYMDNWPGHDRMARVAQRQVGLSVWGPILDHGITFLIYVLDQYWKTGSLEIAAECYPNLIKFTHYLERLIGEEDMVDPEALGVPCIWIDHDAYLHARHKKCPFNLYLSVMFQKYLPALCELFEDKEDAAHYKKLGERILKAVVRDFWSDDHRMFVNNLPWSKEEGIRTCDRSHATALLYDLCPKGDVCQSVNELAERPSHMGISYPCNAIWRYKALAKYRRMDVILDDLRNIWAKWPSVTENNTYQEDWDSPTDSANLWSHAPAAPLAMVFMNIAGIKPILPGYGEFALDPQLGDLEGIELKAYIPQGFIWFRSQKMNSVHKVWVTIPENTVAQLHLNDWEGGQFEASYPGTHMGSGRYRLESGNEYCFAKQFQ